MWATRTIFSSPNNVRATRTPSFIVWDSTAHSTVSWGSSPISIHTGTLASWRSGIVNSLATTNRRHAISGTHFGRVRTSMSPSRTVPVAKSHCPFCLVSQSQPRSSSSKAGDTDTSASIGCPSIENWITVSPSTLKGFHPAASRENLVGCK